MSQMQKGTKNGDIVSKCTSWGSADVDPSVPSTGATEGFRYGCLLQMAVQKPDSLCSVPYSSGSSSSKMPVVCSQTCEVLFAGRDDQIKTCNAAAKKAFQRLIQNGDRCTIDPGVSCIQQMNQPSCVSDSKQRDSQCLPETIGCTLGQMQSSMIARMQQHQQDNQWTVVSCQAQLPADVQSPPTDSTTTNGTKDVNTLFPNDGSTDAATTDPNSTVRSDPSRNFSQKRN